MHCSAVVGQGCVADVVLACTARPQGTGACSTAGREFVAWNAHKIIQLFAVEHKHGHRQAGAKVTHTSWPQALNPLEYSASVLLGHGDRDMASRGAAPHFCFAFLLGGPGKALLLVVLLLRPDGRDRPYGRVAQRPVALSSLGISSAHTTEHEFLSGRGALQAWSLRALLGESRAGVRCRRGLCVHCSSDLMFGGVCGV